MSLLDEISASVARAERWLNGRKPDLALVLGSGLASAAGLLEDPITIGYCELPDFAAVGVVGHAGRLHCGRLSGRTLLLFEGRYHCYEGYNAWQVTAPVRLAAALGCSKILLTNAAGGIDDRMNPGDFMLVTDHLGMFGENPLRGREERQFLDLGSLYRHDFYDPLKEILQQQGVLLHAGPLAWMIGPSYETPAEIRLLKMAGAAAVSMSTVPEAIVARRYGLEIVALSFISNLAAGLSQQTLDHEEVLDAAETAAPSLNVLVRSLLDFWPS